MPDSFDDVLQAFDYAFPPELIAQKPASPRDSARLLVFNRATKKTEWSDFSHIGEFLPKDSVLVLNQTKVMAAKLLLTRASGGTVTTLLLGAEGNSVRIFANRKLKIGEVLELGDTHHFTVTASNEKTWILTPSFAISDLEKILDHYGSMPLPPYIKHSPLTDAELREEYQSVFAKELGSIAAPTASLHFTKKLLEDLEKNGIHIVYVTLHVHLGTFAPLTEEQWKSGILHEESYHIDADAIEKLEQAKKNKHQIIAVGTTVVRTLESASDDNGKIIKPEGVTRLFIRDDYQFKMVDAIITNFHVPRSSLLMLVAAFTGREIILDLYHQAIQKKYRFFSFGDGMLIL